MTGRIALVVPVFPQASETFIVAKAAGLVRRGWDVHVVCDRRRDDLWEAFPELVGPDRVDLEGRVHVRAARPGPTAVADAVRAGTRRGPGGRRRASTYLDATGIAGGRGVLGLVRDAALLDLAPDLVHFEFGSIAVGRTDIGAALGGVPLTVSFRGYDLAFVGLDDPHHYDTVWQATSAVHCLGTDLWNRAVARGCPPDKPHALIPPGVDLGRFAEPAEPRPGALGPEGRPVHLLSVGRLEWKKGYQYGLRAVRALLDAGVAVHWRIVGRGDLSEAIYLERHLLGLTDEVELLGHLPAPAVPEQLRWADVLLHPAVSEGFGNAVLEAQAMQVPVVATDADGLAENVDHGVTGLVVARRDPAALAAAVADLAADGDRRTAMGLAGRRRVEQHFSLDRQLDAWERFYRDALALPVP